MKRIAICWKEFASRGISTALHINARTDPDWRRWQEFLTTHPEIDSIAFEFGTGAAPKARANWYCYQLMSLVNRVGRDLQLVIRGGLALLPELRTQFRRIAFIAPDPLMRARKRRALVYTAGRLRRRRVEYNRGEKIDQLFLQNLAAYTKLVESRKR